MSHIFGGAPTRVRSFFDRIAIDRVLRKSQFCNQILYRWSGDVYANEANSREKRYDAVAVSVAYCPGVEENLLSTAA